MVSGWLAAVRELINKVGGALAANELNWFVTNVSPTFPIKRNKVSLSTFLYETKNPRIYF